MPLFFRRYSATAHSPGVGAGFRKSVLQKFPSFGGVPRYGVRLTFAAFFSAIQRDSAFAGSWRGVQEKRSSKIPLRWRGGPIWSAAIQSRSDLCRFFIRRYCAAAHSPGVGAGFRKSVLQKFLSFGGVVRFGVRQYGNAVTFAAFSFGDTAQQRIRRELAWISGKANFKKSPHLKATRDAPPPRAAPPMERNFLKSDARRAASQSRPSDGVEFLEKRRETRRLPETRDAPPPRAAPPKERNFLKSDARRAASQSCPSDGEEFLEKRRETRRLPEPVTQ